MAGLKSRAPSKASVRWESILRPFGDILVPSLGDWTTIEICSASMPVRYATHRRAASTLWLRRIAATEDVTEGVRGSTEDVRSPTDSGVSILAGAGAWDWVKTRKDCAWTAAAAVRFQSRTLMCAHFAEGQICVGAKRAGGEGEAARARLEQAAATLGAVLNPTGRTASFRARPPLGWPELRHDVGTFLFAASLALDSINTPGPGAFDVDRAFSAAALAVKKARALLSSTVQREREDPTLASVVGEAIELMAPLADSRSVKIAASLHDGGVFLRAPRMNVTRALTNIIGNAVRHSPAGERIFVSSAMLKSHRASIHVSDKGPGFPEELLAHMFDTDWLGHSRLKHGDGLGLPIAKQLIEACGGRIQVSSTHDRPGALVSLIVPASLPPVPVDLDLERPRHA